MLLVSRSENTLRVLRKAVNRSNKAICRIEETGALVPVNKNNLCQVQKLTIKRKEMRGIGK